MATANAEDSLYQHKPFSDQDSIRLLILQPGEYHVNVQIDLIEAPLSNPPQYEALSYVWGTDKPSTPVFCENKRILVTSNCVLALRRLRNKRRRFRNQNASRTLWIDAICINQGSTLERGHQVKLMGQIFSKASHVNIWLGEATPWSDYTMSLFNDYYKLQVSKWPSYIRELRLDRKIQNLSKNETGAAMVDGGSTENVLGSITMKPWFQRVWTIQEYILSRNAQFICGEKILHGSRMFITFHKISSRRYFLKDSNWLIGFNRNFASYIEIFEKLKTQATLEREDSVSSLLGYVRWQCASDPKDFIYGIHGLLHLCQASLDPPDYSKSLASIYINATKSAVIHDGSLNVMLQTSQNGGISGLSSWVPDWSSPMKSLHSIFYRTYKASSNSKSTYKFLDEDKFLRSRCVEVDQVKECSKHLAPTYQDWKDSILLDPSSPHYKKFLQGILKCLSSWKVLIESLHSHPIKEDVENAFFFNLMLEDHPDAKAALYFLVQWLGHDLGEITDGLDQSFVDYTNEITSIRHDPADTVDIALTKQILAYIWDTNLFITSEGFIGRGFSSVKDEDIILLIAGVKAPIIARKVGDKYMSLGPAYIHGMMKGEKWPEDEDELKDIVFC